MQPGDEVEVYHVSAREPWRGEFLSAPTNASGDRLAVVRLRGEMVVLNADGTTSKDGYYLAPKHVARLRGMRRTG